MSTTVPVRTPRVVVAAFVAVAAVLVGLFVQPASAALRAPMAPTLQLDAGYTRGVFWGSNPTGPFTDAQIAQITTHYRYVVIGASHGGFNVATQLADVARLRAANPDIKVLWYWNSKHYLWEDNHKFYVKGFDLGSMALHGMDGSVVVFKSGARPGGIGVYVDTRSAAFRAFYLDIANRAIAAGYDGVAMDSFRPLTLGTDPDAVKAVGSVGVRDWNIAQQWLLAEVNAAMPGKIVLYNGISQTVKSQVNRGLGPLDSTRATLNESFCIERDVPASVAHLTADIKLMQARNDRVLLEKVNFGVGKAWTSAQRSAFRDKYGAFCLGVFLVGWRPGSTYFGFSDGYGLTQLDADMALEQSAIKLGAPVSDATISSTGIATRVYKRGTVVVNLSPTAQRVAVPVAAKYIVSPTGPTIRSLSTAKTSTLGARSSVIYFTGTP